MRIVDVVRELVEPAVLKLQLELVDLEYVKEGKNYFLRLFVDKEGGVDIEECGLLSEQISEILDEKDPIAEAYYLEVSSPGAERPLKKKADYQKFIGRHIYVKFYEPIAGFKEIEGTLIDLTTEDVIKISYKDKTRTKIIEVPLQKIAKARLAVTFN